MVHSNSHEERREQRYHKAHTYEPATPYLLKMLRLESRVVVPVDQARSVTELPTTSFFIVMGREGAPVCHDLSTEIRDCARSGWSQVSEVFFKCITGT
jgi:hypothetical protein